MTFFIHGMYVQSKTDLHVSYASRGKEQGPFLMVGEKLMYYLYTGIIRQRTDGSLCGFVRDEFGEAELLDVQISEQEIRFVKRYPGRNDLIHYRFSKRDETSCVGEYTGSGSGTGIARCVLTEISDEFLNLESALKLLDRTDVFRWPHETLAAP